MNLFSRKEHKMIEFRYPLIFLFYFLLIVFIILKIIINNNEFANWIDYRLKKKLFFKLNNKSVKLKNNLRLIGIVFLIFSASGPQVGKGLKKVERKGADIIFALDISSSMLAEDVKPNRLEKSKFEINKIISFLNGDRVGLIIFSGSAHLYLPLTTDYDAANLFINSVDTEMIRTNGTSINDAIQLSKKSFNLSENNKVLIIISDGEDHQGEAIELAKDFKKNDIIIHSVGVGTLEGSLIPIYNKSSGQIDYKKDKNNKLVKSSFNEKILYEIASVSGGKLYRIDDRNSNIDDLNDKLRNMQKNTLNTHEYAQLIDRYQIFLFISIFIFISEFLIPTINNKNNDK